MLTWEDEMKTDALEPDFKDIIEHILTEVSHATGLTWICVCGRRTMQEQADLYAKGRTIKGPKVTNAPPGSSAHNYGLAADCAPLAKGSQHTIWWEAPEATWKEYGRICEKYGKTWGGHFKSIADRPHCEDPRWKIEQGKWRKESANG
jgi:peptidoglycan LD-endopeptidase CwlK